MDTFSSTKFNLPICGFIRRLQQTTAAWRK